MPSSRCSAASFGLLVLMSLQFSTASAEPLRAAPGPSLVVQPGDSWASVRDRLFPLDAVRKANPGLSPEMLHPGDVVRAPYVPAAALDRERAAREAAESRLAATNVRLAAVEKDRASIEAQRREVDQARGVVAWMRTLVIVVLVVAAVLLALLALLANALREARRDAAEAASRYRDVHGRYEALRQSLHDIEVKIQQRVVSLLQLHGAKIVTDREVQSSMGTVLDFAAELKNKHDGVEKIRPSTAA